MINKELGNTTNTQILAELLALKITITQIKNNK